MELIDPFYKEILPNLTEGGWQVCDEHGAYGTVNFDKTIATPESIAAKCRVRIGLIRYPQHCKYFVEVRRKTGQVATKDIAQGEYKSYPDLDEMAIDAVGELVPQVMAEYKAWCDELDGKYFARDLR